MKFSEYRYERVDVEQVRAAYAALTERVRNAPTADEAAACVLGVRPGRAAQLAEWKGPYTDAEYKKAAAAVRPDKETERQLADLIYVECEGRHAALKQGWRRFKSALDRAAPWLALAVVLFGIAAVIYTAGLAG